MAIPQISVNKMYCAFHWIKIYPVDSNIHPSNNGPTVTMTDFCKTFIYLFIFFWGGGWGVRVLVVVRRGKERIKINISFFLRSIPNSQN